MTSGSSKDSTPDLTACDREPIHVPGSIQPYGVLLSVRADDLRVDQAAGSVEAMFGPDWLDGPASEILGPDLGERLSGIVGGEALPGYIGRIATRVGIVEASAHPSGDRILVDLEPAVESAASAAAILGTIEAAGSAFERATSLKDLCERAAVEFRRLLRFDRVMIYRFLDDDAGEVVAEDRDESISSFLNHHFPASDIPRQARALYVRNLVRVIPDVDYVPAPLRPARTEAPVDMSDSALRSVSPIHVQYLRNMGVSASASVSIVKDGTLWGLIACHNATPLGLSFEQRAAARTLAGSLSRQINAKAESEDYRQRIRLRGFGDDVASAFAVAPSVDAALTQSLEELKRMLSADGVAVVRDATLLMNGRCPPETAIRTLARWLASDYGGRVLATAELGLLNEIGEAHRDVASGLLGVAVVPEEPFCVLWFRAEQVAVVNWAGNPHKPVELNADETLTPRASFEAWTEIVRGRSKTWTAPEREAAGRLMKTLLDARQQRQMRELNRRLGETLADKDALLAQQAVLMKEANHRVQNSLSLVGGFLQLQARAANDAAVTHHLDEAQRRLSAVALVHRRLYRSDQVEFIDLSRYLEDLCVETATSMGEAWSSQITYDIAPISVPTDRAVPVGLILTELVINANKYAYGGSPGPIDIALEQHRTEFRLIVSDRGGGQHKPGAGFGTRMMNALVSQLSGRFEYRSNEPGLRAIVTAPIFAPTATAAAS